MTQRTERRIEKWQWWLLAAWLLFIGVTGFIVLFRLSSLRMAVPPPLPAAPTEFKLGDGPEIEIRGRVLMSDGSPAPKGTAVEAQTYMHDKQIYGILATDENGYYSTTARVGAKFCATVLVRDFYSDPLAYGAVTDANEKSRILDCIRRGDREFWRSERLKHHYALESYAFPPLATTVTDPPSPNQYDIQAADNFIRIYGTLRHPDGTPAAAGRTVTVEAFLFDHKPVLLFRDADGKSRTETFSTFFVTQTRDGGVYEFLLTPGEHLLRPDGTLFSEMLHEYLSLHAGSADREIDFNVRPSSRFRFVSPDGTEWGPGEVRLTAYSIGEYQTGSTYGTTALRESDGSAGFLLSKAGTQFVVATKDGRFGTVRTFHGVESVAPMTLTLQPAARARVRVLDLSDGRPVPDIMVSARSQLVGVNTAPYGPRTTGDRAAHGVRTDENGVAIVEPLYVGGQYELSTHPGIPGPMSRPVIHPVEPGETIDIGDWKISGDFTDHKAGKFRPPERGAPRRKTEKNNETKTIDKTATEPPTPGEP